MSENTKTENYLEWYYLVPAGKDKTLIVKCWKSWLLTMAVITPCALLGGIGGGGPGVWIELLKFLGLIAVFVAVVMVLAFALTGPLIWLLTWPMRARVRRKAKAQNKPEERKERNMILYRFKLDDKKLHSWSPVEVKGGRHIRCRRIFKLKRCKAKHRIEVTTPLGRTILYAEDEDYETVWEALTARCPNAKIVTSE